MIHPSKGMKMGDRDDWAELERVYQKRGLVLAIGAGASCGSGLPTWADLLGRIADTFPADKVFATNGTKLVEDLRREEFSLAAIATILRKRCDGDSEFASRLRDALYLNFPPYKASQANESKGSAAIRTACEANTTLRAVAALCTLASRDHAGEIHYCRNPLVHAIVSFNVDNLLRVYVEARYGRPEGHLLVRSVERASKSSDRRKTPIYYMHGLLRFDIHADDPDKEASDKLVFTEQQYFDFFNDPTSQFNYTFLYLLREHPCLFIGLSMHDDNIRRLLHYSRSERVSAYLDEKRTPPTPGATASASDVVSAKEAPSPEQKSNRHFALLKRHASAHLNDITQESLSLLGTTALWVDDYPDIPTRLRRMYESAAVSPRPDWDLVY